MVIRHTLGSLLSYFIKNVAAINANDLRPIFNRSYVSTKRMYIKVPPVA